MVNLCRFLQGSDIFAIRMLACCTNTRDTTAKDINSIKGVFPRCVWLLLCLTSGVLYAIFYLRLFYSWIRASKNKVVPFNSPEDSSRSSRFRRSKLEPVLVDMITAAVSLTLLLTLVVIPNLFKQAIGDNSRERQRLDTFDFVLVASLGMPLISFVRNSKMRAALYKNTVGKVCA